MANAVIDNPPPLTILIEAIKKANDAVCNCIATAERINADLERRNTLWLEKYRGLISEEQTVSK